MTPMIIDVSVNWAGLLYATLTVLGMFGVSYGTYRLFRWLGKRSASKRDRIQFGQQGFLAGAAIPALHTLVVLGQDALDIPGSLIGKYIQINKITGKDGEVKASEKIATGLVLSENLTQTEDRIAAVHLSIFTVKDEMKTVVIPANERQGVDYQICRTNCGDVVKPGGADIISDIVNFCQNQCIFDCKNCALSKYGVRKTTGKES